MARLKAHGRLSIRVNGTFLVITVLELRRNVYSSAVFAEVDLFAVKFYFDRSSPSTILGARKLETLGYPTAEHVSGTGNGAERAEN